METFAELLHSYTFTIVGFALALLIGLAALSIILKHKTGEIKRLLFGLISAVTLFTTVYLVASTVYGNVTSISKGPVHWHADFEIWACGKEFELKDPSGLSNKIGTSVLHEHNDKRIHLEGVLFRPEDATLGKFFDVIGGNLEEENVTFPGTDGIVFLSSGISCGDGIDRKLQVFVFKTDGEYYRQEKVIDPMSYQFAPQQQVPPGDCIIIELDQLKSRTDKLCTSYEAAMLTGKLKGERN